MSVASLVTYIRQSEILLLSFFWSYSRLDLLAQRHQLNNFFINFKNEYIYLLYLLVVFLQLLNVPWTWEPLSFQGFQVITALQGVVDDSVGTLSYGAKFSLGRVFSRRADLAQDEVANVQSSELYPLVVVFSHLLLVYRHSTESFVSYFVQKIQVDLQLVVVVFFAQYLSPDAGYSYLDQDYCFSAVGESKWNLSCWGPHGGSVCPQNIWQFLQPCTVCLLQSNFDDLQQRLIHHFHLSVGLWMSWRRKLVLDSQSRVEFSEVLIVELVSIV